MSRKISDLFDHYTLYRPEMVLEWESGRDGGWQAQLWRELASDCSEKHRAALWRLVMDLLAGNSPPVSPLPSRVAVFGIPVLPPFHLEVLHALSMRVRVCLFLLNPCREFWGDIATRRHELRERSQAALAGRPEAGNHLEIGNALLSSMGLQGRQFLNLLLDKEEVVEKTDYRDPGEGNLLACIQSDILNLRDRGRNGAKKVIPAHDVSIQVHSVHGPLREMEVLNDYLLALFEELPDLHPRDIVVMTPQIETYAPFISAVFGRAEDVSKSIPFSIADRSPRSESLLIQAFLKMLRLSRGRFSATEVMDLLDSPPVQSRFGLIRGDMETIQVWLEATGIRWGIDGEDRKRFGIPGFEENSWQEGLRRLLIGYAMRSENDCFFENILPYDDVEGSESLVLGRFADFVFSLFASIRGLDTPRSPQAWKDGLLELFDRFILADEQTEREVQLVRSQLHAFASAADSGGFAKPVGIETVRFWLEEKLQGESWTQGFLAGGITFCEMLPMRSIPFRVVALVGLDSSAFPRPGRPPGFDLIAQDPRPGDRSLRDEDRYLFLEALLSARERLYISYVGQSIQDNSEIPPSPLVNELLDYIEQGFAPDSPAEPLQKQLLVQHRLQAFSRAYFTGDEKLFSYSQDNLDALKAHAAGQAEQASFMRTPAADPSEEWRSLNVRVLKRFFRQPVEYFLRERLGIRLQENAAILEDAEPFAQDGLSRYEIEQEIASKLLAGEDISDLESVIRSRGILPPGAPGRALYQSNLREAREFVRTVQSHLDAGAPSTLELNLDLNGFHIDGRIGELRDGRLLRYRCSRITPKDQIQAWIDHLALNVAAGNVETILIGKEGAYRFSAPEVCRDYFACLLEVYWAGLKEPLHFFPSTSFEYAEKIHQGKGREPALAAAQRKWAAAYNDIPGEGDDLYNRLVFKDREPFDEPFEELAVTILRPLLMHRVS